MTISYVRPVPIKFGSYTFPKGFYFDTDNRGAEMPINKLARAQGATALPRRLKERRISVKGNFVWGQLDTDPNTATARYYNHASPVKDAVDDLMAACAIGDSILDPGPGTLYLRSDRYYRNAQAEEPISSSPPGKQDQFVKLSVTFVLLDPYQYAATASIDTGWTSPASGSTHVVTYGDGTVANGTAPAAPTITITLAASALLSITLLNEATGETITVNGTPNPAATVLNIDCLNEIVQDNASPANDQTAVLVEPSTYPALLPGANTWKLTINAGNAATISSIAFTWNARWY